MVTDNEQSAFETFQSDPISLTVLARTSPVEALTKLYALIDAALNDFDYDASEDVTINGYDLEEMGGEKAQGVRIELVNKQGGGEGGGGYVERVYALIDDATGETLSFVRQTGSYYSHDGTYWDEDLEQVYPHQVTVTKYSVNP